MVARLLIEHENKVFSPSILILVLVLISKHENPMCAFTESLQNNSQFWDYEGTELS